MKTIAASAALVLTAFLGTALPAAAARDGFVIDETHLLSAATVSQINAKVSDFKASTGKEVVVDIEASTNGDTGVKAAEKSFATNQVDGVLIYVAKQPKTVLVGSDNAGKRWFSPATRQTIANSIKTAFNGKSYDDGINNAVDQALSIYRQHLNVRPVRANREAVTSHQDVGGGFNMSWIFIIIGLVVVFLIVRAIFRAMAGPRNYGPPGGPGYGPGPGYGGPGYGGPGYGGGGGFGGGGGGFFSGLLGGLGGAFIGNELFGGRRDETIVQNPGQYSDVSGGGAGGGDQSGWQSDAGQTSDSNFSSADWGGGDSGGGDSGGGWGGGDSGGGDSGGGW